MDVSDTIEPAGELERGLKTKTIVDLNQLLDPFGSTSYRANRRRSAMKKPVGAGSSSTSSSRIGFSDPVSLKQAFRGRCISQASEMAAMRTRRPLKPGSTSSSKSSSSLGSPVEASHPGQQFKLSKGKAFPEINSSSKDINPAPALVLETKARVSRSDEGSRETQVFSELGSKSSSSRREAAHLVRNQQRRSLEVMPLKLLKKLGCGNVGTVYIAGPACTRA